MIFEGDFVPGVVAGQTKAKAKTDYNVFPFPAVNGRGGDYVVGGGNVVVMFKDSPAARALVLYLASPEAGEIWAKRGGFSSPNKNVKPSVYPDDITRTTATALAKATTFRFDLSDLAPAAFGSKDDVRRPAGVPQEPLERHRHRGDAREAREGRLQEVARRRGGATTGCRARASGRSFRTESGLRPRRALRATAPS